MYSLCILVHLVKISVSSADCWRKVSFQAPRVFESGGESSRVWANEISERHQEIIHMETETILVRDNEIKIEEEIVSRKDDVKVTNLLPEISCRTSDLSKESPMQVNIIEEEEDSNIEEGELKDVDDRTDAEKEKEEKGDTNVEDSKKVDSSDKKAEEVKTVDDGEKVVDEVKKVENGDKKTEEVKKVESGDKKTDDTKKVEKGGKKADEIKKVESGDKKADDTKKVEKGAKKPDDNKALENEEKKKKDFGKSQKKEHPSPLAEFFKDWDKFTTRQKIDIERYIMDKAKQLGASTELKSGVRTLSGTERNRYKWRAIRRKRESRQRRLETSRFESSRSLRDRRPSSRLRGAGDSSRPRTSREDRRWRRYSPPREALPWRSPWVTSPPVESLIKQMQRFVQLVDKYPSPNNFLTIGTKRQPLLPTPPVGYDRATRYSVQPFALNGEESSRRYYGKEPSSQSLSKQRTSPYNAQGSFSSSVLRKDNWSNRERNFSQNSATAVPYQESRYNWRRN